MTGTPSNSQEAIWEIGALRLRKPGLWPVFITVLLVSVCFALGVWQVQRLGWKQELIAQLESRQKAAPLLTEQLPEDRDALAQENFRMAQVRGKFLYEREFHLIGKYYRGKLGYGVLTPLRLEGSGKLILVNRGWVPTHRKEPENRTEDAKESGIVTVNGMILYPQKGSRFLPDHDVKGNVWFWYDIARMEQESGLQLAPVVLESVNSNTPGNALPIPQANADVQLRNDHLQYALVWFSLACAGIIIFLLYHWNAAKNQE